MSALQAPLAHTQRRPCSRIAPRSRNVRARASGKDEDVYIGQGKYVKDDPKKYPSKTQLTGGWAGGEEGLQKWLQQNKHVQPSTESDERPEGPSTKLLKGKDVIYTGKGNYVRDDAQKYPSKSSITGGFAGGERGVSKFVAEGDIDFDEDFRPQTSPLIIGLAISGVAIAISSVWFAVTN